MIDFGEEDKNSINVEGSIVGYSLQFVSVILITVIDFSM
jgi:hypothetical protein